MRRLGLEDGNAVKRNQLLGASRGGGRSGSEICTSKCQGELLLSEGPDTLSQRCSRKGLRLVHYIVSASLCYAVGGFGKSREMQGMCQLTN